MIVLGYSDIAGGGVGVAKFVTRVISGAAKQNVQMPEAPPLSDHAHHAHYVARPCPRQSRCRMPASFFESPPPPVESGHRNNSDGYYTVFGLGDDALRIRKGGFVHEVAFSYESS